MTEPTSDRDGSMTDMLGKLERELAKTKKELKRCRRKSGKRTRGSIKVTVIAAGRTAEHRVKKRSERTTVVLSIRC